MAKDITIDGVNTIMHFNSSVFAHRASCHLPGGTCCFCHQELDMQPPAEPGDSVLGTCHNCGQMLVCKTVVLSLELATYFDVRSPTGDLGVGAVMHIYLPPNHPEFDSLINQIDPTTPSGIVTYAKYGLGEPSTPEFQLAQAEFIRAIQEQAPEYYARLVGQDTDLPPKRGFFEWLKQLINR